MRLLGIMHMESWSTARMRLSDYEGERFKPVLVTRQAVCELAGYAIVIIKLIKIEKEVGWIVGLLWRVRELFVRQLWLSLGKNATLPLRRSSPAEHRDD